MYCKNHCLLRLKLTNKLSVRKPTAMIPMKNTYKYIAVKTRDKLIKHDIITL